MPARGIAQQAQIIGQHHGGFSGQKAGAVGLGILNPRGADFIRVGYARVFIHQDKRVGVILDPCGFGLHRVLEIGHDHVDPRGERFGLACAQIIGQARDVRVCRGLIQHSSIWQCAGPNGGGISKIGECF